MRLLASVAIVLWVGLAGRAVAAAEGGLPDALQTLPAPAKPAPAPAADLGQPTAIAPAILAAGERVVLEGVTIVDQGPVDGLEVLACLEGGKTHESLVRLGTGNGQLVKFAFISILGVDDGQPATEGSGQPARGTPLRVQVQWKDPDQPGRWLGIDASCLVRDRVTDRAYPPLPFVYTGSRMLALTEVGPDGQQVRRERFMLDNTKSVAVNYDEPDALLASPFPVAASDQRFEANSAVTPPPQTPVRVVFSKAVLPLTLALDAAGGLARADAPTQPLDDAALAAALGAAFAGADAGRLAAVGVLVDPAGERAQDVAARARLLAAAAAAGVWAVPVFIPRPDGAAPKP